MNAYDAGATGGVPVAVPLLGAVFDLGPLDWRTDDDQTRLRVGRILGEVSGRYRGRMVPLEPTINGILPVRHVLVRVEAMPKGSPDADAWPAINRVPKVPIDELQPGLEVRIGKGAVEHINHSFYFRITEVGDRLPDDRIWLTGHRLTTAGRPIEHVTICTQTDSLFPVPAIRPAIAVSNSIGH